MDVLLKSDFKDWYDYAFAMPAPPKPGQLVFKRRMNGGPARHVALGLMKTIGLKVPLFFHGPTHDLDRWPELEPIRATAAGRMIVDHMLVVRHFGPQNHQHAGEGKELTTLAQLRLLPSHTTSTVVQFMPSNRLKSMNSLEAMPMQGKSLRLLRIGEMDAVLLRYQSSTDWRSNCGDVEVLMLPRETHEMLPISQLDFHARELQGLLHAPLLAIDFVEFDEPPHKEPASVHAPHKHSCYAIDLNVAPGLDPLKDSMEATQIHDAVRDFLAKRNG